MSTYILGFDEVGRGALAGPVTVGLVALSQEYPLYTYKHSQRIAGVFPSQYSEITYIRDSKHVTESKRSDVLEYVQHYAIPYSVLSASNVLIDRFGISACLRHLLLIGFSILNDQVDITSIYVDGSVYFPQTINQELITELLDQNNLQNAGIELQFPTAEQIVINENKADDIYLAIAMASCCAKVTRDSWMIEQAMIYPEFGWDTNKGYGTERNRAAIARNPHNPLLRTTFIGNIPKSLE